MQLLFIVGSLRKGSLNKQFAEQAAKDMQERYGARCTFLTYDNIPYLNQDIEFPAPSTVAAVRREVESADGVWFFTPEYNHSYPGLLKNLVDWLSRSLTPGGPLTDTAIAPAYCAVTSVGGGAHGRYCLAAMKSLLEMTSHVMTDPLLGIGYTREEEKQSVLQMTPERLEQLRTQEDAFVEYLQANNKIQLTERPRPAGT